MDLDIIIVNWNGGELLARCVHSIMTSETAVRTQVIVVDNASRDGSARDVESRYPDVKVIFSEENTGFGRGNNAARPLVGAPFVLFLNPDTEVPAGALDGMVDSLAAREDAGALGCMMTDPDGTVHGLGLQWFPSPLTEFLQYAFLVGPVRKLVSPWLPTVDPGVDGYVDKLYGGCLMVRKTVLDSVGWFDDRFFMYAEDVDLCRRIAKGGWRLYYLSKVAIRHVAGAATREAPSGFSTIMKCESIGKLMRKYYGALGAGLYRCALFAASLLRVIPLGILLVLTRPVSRRRSERLEPPFRKSVWVLSWSLGLKEPSIPR